MTIIRLKDAIEYKGKLSYTIDAVPIQMEDGTGLLIRASYVPDKDDLYALTMIPWTNITSMTSMVPAEAFEPEQDDDDVPDPADKSMDDLPDNEMR